MELFTGNLDKDAKTFCDFYYETVIANFNLLEHDEDPEIEFCKNMSVIMLLTMFKQVPSIVGMEEQVLASQQFFRGKDIPSNPDDIIKFCCANIRGAEIRAGKDLVTIDSIKMMLVMSIEGVQKIIAPDLKAIINSRMNRRK